MIRNTEIKKIRKLLNSTLLSSRVDDDIWRLENNFFGLKFRPDKPNGCAIFIGLCSGLEVLRLLNECEIIRVAVVDNDSRRCAELLENIKISIGQKNLQKRFFICSSIEQLSEFISDGKIDFCRIDKDYFSIEILHKLVVAYNIDHICGEFDELDADPMLVYRFCRNSVKSFFWRVVGYETPLTLRGLKYEFEITVVVPCYKVLPWMDRCIESLLNQTIDSIEIIAVDDGSPDDTGKKLDEWAMNYPNKMRVIHKANGGCASSRNTGLTEAKGEFVAFVDADDWVDVRMFELLYRSAILNATDVAQCGYSEVFEDSGRIEDYPTAWGGKDGHGRIGLVDDPQSYLTVKPTIWRRIYRKDFLSNHDIVFPPHIRRFDDLPFQFEVLSRLIRMSIIPDCLYFYRQEREGQDIAVRDRRLFVHFPIFDWINDRIANWIDAGIERYLVKCKINTHMWALSRIDSEFYSTYYSHASHDIFRRNVHLTLWDYLKIAMSSGIHTSVFMIKAFLISIKSKPDMVASD